MLRSILDTPTYDHLFSFNDEGGTGDGGGGSGGSGSGAGDGGEGKDDEGKGKDKGKATLTEADFTRRMRERTTETKQKTTQEIADDLGVSLPEAKRLIAAAKAREDSEKSEAQLAREAADKEKADAASEKTASAQAKHEANVERAILRAMKITDDMDDEAIDKKVSRLARLVDVEVGSDAEAIKAAVKALKDEEPLMFGVTEDNGEGGKGDGKPKHTTGDPKGTPPKKTGAEGAFEKGQKRAAGQGTQDGYAILAAKN